MRGRMKAVGLLLGVLGVMVMCLGGVANAATDSKSVTVTAAIPALIRLTLGSGTVDLGTVDPETSPAAATLGASVSSNRPWTLTVSKSGDLYNSVDDYSIPSSQLTFTVTTNDGRVTSTGSGEFGTDTQVAAGNRGGNISLNVNYSLVVTYDDPAGNYSATHTYTATTL